MSSSIKLFGCAHCDRRFEHNFTLRRHVKISHPGLELPPVMATSSKKRDKVAEDELERSYKSAQQLDTQTVVRPSLWHCDHCSKSYCRHSLLCKHIRTHHPGQSLPDDRRRQGASALSTPEAHATDVQGVCCKYCSKSFQRNSNLRRHIRVLHAGCSVPLDGRSVRYRQSVGERVELKFDNING